MIGILFLLACLSAGALCYVVLLRACAVVLPLCAVNCRTTFCAKLLRQRDETIRQRVQTSDCEPMKVCKRKYVGEIPLGSVFATRGQS